MSRSWSDIKDPIRDTPTPIKSMAPTVIAAVSDCCGVVDQAEDTIPRRNITTVAINNALVRLNSSQPEIDPKRGTLATTIKNVRIISGASPLGTNTAIGRTNDNTSPNKWRRHELE